MWVATTDGKIIWRTELVDWVRHAVSHKGGDE